MLHYQIKCYNQQNEYCSNTTFFVLNKGLNSGKPMQTPCPNCFIITCSNASDRDYYFTLCFGLWKAKHFDRIIFGSVVPFIRIREFKSVLDLQANNINMADFNKVVNKVKSIEQMEANISRQMQLLKSLKINLINTCIKR